MSFTVSGTLPFPKFDLRPLPANADRTRYYPAADWNAFGQALDDLRAAVGPLSIFPSGSLTLKSDSGGGTHPTLSLVSGSTNRAGVINISLGAGADGIGAILTASFSAPYDHVPFVQLSRVNINSANLGGASPYVNYASTTTGSFVIMPDGILSSGTLYQFMYAVVG